MKIALVYTNSEANVGRGAGCIAAALADAGQKVVFFDTFYMSPEEATRRIATGGFDLLMISTMTLLFPQALSIARQVKAVRDLPVLMGGVHPTIVGGKLLQEHPEIDFLCIGEGETMVTEFVRRFGTDAIYDLDNLAYRRQGRLHTNPLAPPTDLSRLPPFPWHLFPDRSVVQPNQGFLYVTATRGCPYNCTYCCNGIYLRHYGAKYLRFRPVEQVVNELGRLNRRYGPKLFYFGDEMILADKAYAEALFTAIGRHLNMPYGCMMRVEHATAETAALLKRTGCRYVSMGIECGDEAFRKAFLNRKMSNARLKDGFKNIQAQGIFTTSFNMVGYPVDYDDDLTAATYRLNREIQPDYCQVSIFYPFPGTRLYDYCVVNDLIDWERMARQNRYYEDSVLKARSVQSMRRAMMQQLNPQGFRFPQTKRAETAATGLRMALAPTLAWDDSRSAGRGIAAACKGEA
jgi:anaerobic magnesium-protoporphyrin IX monomethyl ester cyclase